MASSNSNTKTKSKNIAIKNFFRAPKYHDQDFLEAEALVKAAIKLANKDVNQLETKLSEAAETTTKHANVEDTNLEDSTSEMPDLVELVEENVESQKLPPAEPIEDEDELRLKKIKENQSRQKEELVNFFEGPNVKQQTDMLEKPVNANLSKPANIAKQAKKPVNANFTKEPTYNVTVSGKPVNVFGSRETIIAGGSMQPMKFVLPKPPIMTFDAKESIKSSLPAPFIDNVPNDPLKCKFPRRSIMTVIPKELIESSISKELEKLNAAKESVTGTDKNKSVTGTIPKKPVADSVPNQPIDPNFEPKTKKDANQESIKDYEVFESYSDNTLKLGNKKFTFDEMLLHMREDLCGLQLFDSDEKKKPQRSFEEVLKSLDDFGDE